MSDLERLTDALSELASTYGCSGLKFGTEVEHCDFWEVQFFHELVQSVSLDLPITVKIGGPEARNDLDSLSELCVSRVLAPKVESPHSLRMFVNAADEVMGHRKRRLVLGINVETITAVERLDELVSSAHGMKLEQLSVGRVDLSESLSLSITSPRVTQHVIDVVAVARRYGKRSAVGGGMTPEEGQRVATEIRPDMINTRFVYFGVDRMGDACKSIVKALQFEVLASEYLRKVHPTRSYVYEARIEKAMLRLR